MRQNVVYTKHFGERYLERVPKDKFHLLQKKIKHQVNSKQCELVFECILDGKTKVEVDGFVVPIIFIKESMKLHVMTIHSKVKGK